MLKGVSQKVIEVIHTDNRYFEKAILFLRPSAQEEDKAKLRAKAGEYLAQINYRPTEKPPEQSRLPELVKIALGALGGAAAACLFFLF